jgi:hypothetical protein
MHSFIFQMDLDLEAAEKTYQEMCAMERDFEKKYGSLGC